MTFFFYSRSAFAVATSKVSYFKTILLEKVTSVFLGEKKDTRCGSAKVPFGSNLRNVWHLVIEAEIFVRKIYEEY